MNDAPADRLVLLIDDHPERTAGVCHLLPQKSAKLSVAISVTEALHLLMLYSFDVAAVCATLERASFLFSFLFDLRRAKNTLLLLYSIPDPEDRADCLSRGFDMCLASDHPKECAAAIAALLRWPGSGPLQSGERPPGRIIFKDLTIDPMRQLVTMRGEVVDLTTAEFRILYLMASNPGLLFTREHIYERIRGVSGEYGVMGISNTISSLRQKLGLSPKDTEYIRTIHGAGYRFGM